MFCFAKRREITEASLLTMGLYPNKPTIS
jgi:hypothetical protein